MKKVYTLLAIALLGLVIGCSKERNEETTTTTETKEVITPTEITLKISSMNKNFDFTSAKVWVTDKSIYVSNQPVYPTNVLEKVNISSDGIMVLNTEKYIGKTLYFNVFSVEGKTQYPSYTTDVRKQIIFKDTFVNVPKKGNKITATTIIN